MAKIGEKLISVSDTIKQLQQLIRFAESVVFGAIWKINKFPGADRIELVARRGYPVLVFTTLQKFATDAVASHQPTTLSASQTVVIVDEVHRSHKELS